MGTERENVAAALRLFEKMIAISQTGLTYTQGVYDRERYEQLRELVGEAVQVLLPNEPPFTQTFPREEGYRTPKVDVRGIVLAEGKLLLVRERADGLWALPGGWADVGLSPAENIEKEIFEESGYKARAVRLLALLDRDKHAHDPSPWHTYKIFFQCELVGGSARATLETDGAEFFALDALPPLSIPRVTLDQLKRTYELASTPDSVPWFE
jgi:ADP-ribose pyrophosphatase YjhB (NUDIX family)